MNESEGIAGPSIVSTRPRTLEGWGCATGPAGKHREKPGKSTGKQRENAEVMVRWRLSGRTGGWREAQADKGKDEDHGLPLLGSRGQLKWNWLPTEIKRLEPEIPWAHRSRLKQQGLSFGRRVPKTVTDATNCFDEIRMLAKFLSQRADVNIDRPLEHHGVGTERRVD